MKSLTELLVMDGFCHVKGGSRSCDGPNRDKSSFSSVFKQHPLLDPVHLPSLLCA